MDRRERQRLGQWYTPPRVADLALRLALGPLMAARHVPRDDDPQTMAVLDRAREQRVLDRAREQRVLDPCCGDGAFLMRAAAAGVAERALVGLDLDPEAVAQARARLPGAQIACGDVFAERSLDGQFDAVVGNPPYVRQELIPAAGKARIRDTLLRMLPQADTRDLERLSSRGDMAAACVLRALHFARPGALVCLVVSSALLSADYAASLWRSVALLGRVRAIVDAPRERWFADAAVNSLILLLERHPLEGERATAVQADSVLVASLRVPTAHAANEVRSLDDLCRVADVRDAPARSPERWLAFARAPGVFFELEALASDALVPLGELVDIRRGVTSGANRFFYLRREEARALELEPAFLVPLLRSPRVHSTISVDPESTRELALVCPPDLALLERYPSTARYIQAHAYLAERPTMRGRHPWWSLRHGPARLFLTKAYGARFVQHLASAPMIADQRVYALHPRRDIDVRVLAAVLNSTFTTLAIECMGRASMGEGALEWTVADARSLPVLDPRRLDAAARRALTDALAAMEARTIGAVDEERSAPDRRALDLALAEVRPGLANLLDRIWPALVRAVAQRNRRPTSHLGSRASKFTRDGR